LVIEKVAQDAFSKSISLPEVDTQTGTTPPELPDGMTAYLITVAIIGIVIILMAAKCNNQERLILIQMKTAGVIIFVYSVLFKSNLARNFKRGQNAGDCAHSPVACDARCPVHFIMPISALIGR
jgi:hypothetical protein